jgi:hypothetical protein
MRSKLKYIEFYFCQNAFDYKSVYLQNLPPKFRIRVKEIVTHRVIRILNYFSALQLHRIFSAVI